jgi:hypothetical protein
VPHYGGLATSPALYTPYARTASLGPPEAIAAGAIRLPPQQSGFGNGLAQSNRPLVAARVTLATFNRET